MSEIGDAAGTLVGAVAMTGRRAAPNDALHDFAAVYDECFPVVLRYILARVRDPVLAEDLTGDVFERALGGWHTFQGRSSARTWVLGIAHHVVAHHWRRTGPKEGRLEDLPFVPEATEPAVEQIAEQREDEARLRRALALLPPSDGEILALRFAADLSFREIAAVVGAREVTVRVRAHRALSRLGKLLRSEEV